jgi:hypothetical protein
MEIDGRGSSSPGDKPDLGENLISRRWSRGSHEVLWDDSESSRTMWRLRVVHTHAQDLEWGF